MDRCMKKVENHCVIHSSDDISAVLCMSVLYSCAKVTRIAVLPKVSFTISSENQTHENWSK